MHEVRLHGVSILSPVYRLDRERCELLEMYPRLDPVVCPGEGGGLPERVPLRLTRDPMLLLEECLGCRRRSDVRILDVQSIPGYHFRSGVVLR